MNPFSGDVVFLDPKYIYGVLLIPLSLLVIHSIVGIVRNVWRKKNGLITHMARDLAVSTAVWGGTFLIVFFYFNKFYKLQLDHQKMNVVLSFPFRTKSIFYEDIQSITLIKPNPKALSVREGWFVRIDLISGKEWTSMVARPTLFTRWGRDRITRKQLLSYFQLFDPDTGDQSP